MTFHVSYSAVTDKLITTITGNSPLSEVGPGNAGESGRRARRVSGPRAIEEEQAKKKWHEGLYGAYGKRILDLVLTTVILITVLPVIVVIAFLVALDGANPFFAHQRVGLHGRLFGCLKIRTMVRDADKKLAEVLANDPVAAMEWKQSQKLSRDPRVTRLGRILRKTSLDELPQLWNVLRGDMSLVGPRPVVLEELERYGPSKEAYLSVRPGITGPWQAEGRNCGSYDARVALDRAYARGFTLMGDLRLIGLTAVQLLTRPTGV